MAEIAASKRRLLVSGSIYFHTTCFSRLSVLVVIPGALAANLVAVLK